MYTPPHFKETDKNKILGFIREYPFGILVSNHNVSPIATHVPFCLDAGSSMKLSTHIAIGNKQIETLNGNEVLVIFQEPHAYISPTLYNKKQNVPTWDYVAVHCYGKCEVLNGTEQKERILRTMIREFEDSYSQQYDELPKAYKHRLMKGIVGVEVKVERTECSFKLSQNKTPEEKARIANHLMSNEDTNASTIGQMIKSNLDVNA